MSLPTLWNVGLLEPFGAEGPLAQVRILEDCFVKRGPCAIVKVSAEAGAASEVVIEGAVLMKQHDDDVVDRHRGRG